MRKKSKNKLNPLSFIFFLFISFGFSYLFSSAYQLGDQFYYRQFYFDLADVSIYEIPPIQSFYTGSNEPLYGLIAWIGAQLKFDKDVYFSIINSFLCVALLQFLLKNSATKIYIALAFINFYILVLIGPAERLKIALFFTFLAITVSNAQLKFGFLIAALLSHFQMLILLGSWLFGLIPRISLASLLQTKKLIVGIFAITGFSIFSWWFYSIFSDILILKFNSYQSQRGILAVLNIGILMIVSYLILQRKFEAILSLTITGIAASILGPERINMIAFLIFSYFVIHERQTGHPIVIALMIYFAFKGVIFLIDVFNYGTGF